MEFVYHNPPSSKRRKAKRSRAGARRKFSAAQLANMRRFAAMARARRGKAARAKRRRKTTTKARRVVVAVTPRRATTMPRTRKSRRRGTSRRTRRASGGGASRRGFLANPFTKDVLMDAAGVVVAGVAIPKIVEKFGASFVKDADGKLNSTKYIVAKAAAGAVLAAVLNMAKQSRMARAVAIGTAAQIGQDFVYRSMPKLAPAPLSGDMDYLTDGEAMGSYLPVVDQPLRVAG